MRELRNIVIRLTVKQAGRLLATADLEPEFDVEIDAPSEDAPGEGDVIAQAVRHLERSRGIQLDQMLQSLERGYIEAALRHHARQRQPGGKTAGRQPHHALQQNERRRTEGRLAMALYLDHFGLDEPPFRITPHPDFFFDGADRGATLEGLLYAILHDEGIVKVSGEIGSGKTTLCRVMMERLPAEVETVFLANPSYSRSEILLAIAEELGLPASNDPRCRRCARCRRSCSNSMPPASAWW